MTIKETYRNFLLQIQKIYPLNEASVITEWVFESVAHINKAKLLYYPEKYMTAEINERLNECMYELLQHKPVQYVLGEAWFYKMEFRVNEHVLIPRQETEELVELVLTTDNRRQTTSKILDIGTGTGCIAIAL